tara:strand:+ start:274 stop:2235 length:1962 start_codon:yes stop_codon:yes gene_type:complete
VGNLSNQLKNEKSPYLKQHESNPVHWAPWNKKSLLKAKQEKKPIFLSIGYASCHWCHVMAHESFEDKNTAKIMNENFINIKVDREERPDIDFIFQKSLGILTGAQGGWPLSMFLDENAVPFTGGTYFPPKELQGRPSFKNVLENVSKVYSENREKIIKQVEQMRMVFDELNSKNAVLKQDLEPLAEKILQYMDITNGGLQGSPKFPQFYIFETLFYFYKKNKKQNFCEHVERLLKNISSKGIYDQLAGGIARYTVDNKWIIPHFEKMLYDNIQYVKLLNNYFNNTQDIYYKNKLEQTINFINQDFKTNQNLIGSAYDADSEGVEGKFYVWKYSELEKYLSKDLEIFKKKYNISEDGNFEKNNILIENDIINADKEEKNSIKSIEKNLLVIRNRRKKPLFDDKVQTDLNCYWAYTLFHSSFVLESKKIYEIANNLFLKINARLEKNIFHCYDKNDSEISVFLEDYVYYGLLLLTVYEITRDENSLNKSKKILKNVWELFFDEKNKVLQKNPKKNNDLFVNPIDLIDNNIPNGNSIFLLACNKIFNISEDRSWKDKVELLKKSFHSAINTSYSQMFSYIKVLDICDENITFTFHGNNKEFSNIKNYLIKNYFEVSTIIYKESKNENFILICKNQVCSHKLKTLDEIKEYLDGTSI